ncbi:MAG: hypothetical protein JXB30_11590 [Anaerolineae bacterium]|nr:hypothetical protein [Anaerolineae bacterium]
MKKRYKTLRLCSTIFKVIGGIVAILTLLMILGICIWSTVGGRDFSRLGELGPDPVRMRVLGHMAGRVIFALMGFLYGGTIATLLFALGEGINLLLGIEENSQTMVELLRGQAGSSQASQEIEDTSSSA